LNSGCGRLAGRRLWISNGKWLNNRCSRPAKRQLRIPDGLGRSSVLQEVVDSTRDELFSRLESFLNLLYAPGGLIFLKKDVCKALCKSCVPIILGYLDSAGP